MQESQAASKTQYDDFQNKISTMSKDEVLSDETMAQVFFQDNEVYRQRLILALRRHAREVKIPMSDFDGIAKAHRQQAASYNKEMAKKEAKTKSLLKNFPNWYAEGEIDENIFCEEFNTLQNMHCINGMFYTEAGQVDEHQIEKEIRDEIAQYITKKIASKVSDLIKALKIYCFAPQPEPDMKRIHVKNGCLQLDGSFYSLFDFCLNRLNVEYHKNAGAPEKWLSFLNDLLYSEDILTLQEYCGYCLIPSTKSQVMLFIIGNGGEGKSCIGVVLKDILGSSMVSGSLHDLEENRFALANLENKLLFLDDDLSTNACEESKNQKKIITAEAPFLIERKGIQPYESRIYSRLLAFGNVALNTMYDHSEGVFRRRIILTTKLKKSNRKDDRFLIEKLAAEKESIFLWCFEGLQRLIANGFQFSVSDRSKGNLEESKQDNYNVIAFLKDESYLTIGNPECTPSTTCKEIYQLYSRWCYDNEELPMRSKSVIAYLKINSEKLGIRYNFNVRNNEGKRVRGFDGIEIVMERDKYGGFDM